MARSKGSNRARPGTIRIIGGKWRRRQIPLPDSDVVRPTPDRVRETLFNWLDPILPGARCLDLFAGSGALGFEALSRGASHCVLVESQPEVAAALEKACTDLDAEAEVLRSDAARYLGSGKSLDFDIVFVDPPYPAPVDSVLEALTARLEPGAQIYLERDRHSVWPDCAGLVWTRHGTAGSVAYGLASVGQ